MNYNRLGKAGIRVSELSFGSWLTFGDVLDREDVKKCIRLAFDQGVNLFDTAEVYGGGEAEDLLGQALQDYRREDLVVSTKIFWGGSGPNDQGLSRKHIMEGTKNSLKRLKMDYVDLLFCHRPDPNTPLEETVCAMDRVVRSGLAFYWGTSEWSPLQIEQAHMVARQINATPPVVEQPEYSMFHRDRVEQEYAPMYEKFGMGTTIWSPLAQGLLSGKYNEKIPPGSRFDKSKHLKQSLTKEKKLNLKHLGEIAKDLDCSMAQLAIAWCLKNPYVSSVITGASRPEQLQENLLAVQVKEKLDPEVMERIERILEPNHEVVSRST